MCVSRVGASWAEALRSLDTRRPNVARFGAVQSQCERAGQWTLVLQMLDIMVHGHRGLQADIKGLGTTLSACRRHWQLGLEVLSQGSRLAVELSDISWNAGIGACAYGHQWLHSFELLRHVQGPEDKVQRDAQGSFDLIQYRTALNSAAKACEHRLRWDMVLSLMHKMRSIQPDAFSCSTCISACGRTERWEDSVYVWREFQARNVKPNVVAYGAMCSACRTAPESLLSVFLEEMKELRLSRNLIILNIELSCAQWQEALLLLEQMDGEAESTTKNPRKACGTEQRLAPNLVSLRQVATVLSQAGAHSARWVLGRLASMVQLDLQSRRPNDVERVGRFSSFLLMNSAIETLELLDACDLASAKAFRSLHRRLPISLSSKFDVDQIFGLGRHGTEEALKSTCGCAGRSVFRWVGWARYCARSATVTTFMPFERRNGNGELPPFAQQLLAWRSATFGDLQSAVVPYGATGLCDELAPVVVEHDRSRHAERRALVSLLTALKTRGSWLTTLGFHTDNWKIWCEASLACLPSQESYLGGAKPGPIPQELPIHIKNI